jgi:aspartate 1-decarboxylase
MQLTILKSKIHRATVTGASLHYEGSLTVSSDLAELVDLREYEKILVGNLTNSERFETYVIYGEQHKGLIELNGATAHLGKIGDRITIMNFGSYSVEEAARHQPRILVLDEKNRVVRQEGIEPSLSRSSASSCFVIPSECEGPHNRSGAFGRSRVPLGPNRTGCVCAARDDRR